MAELSLLEAWGKAAGVTAPQVGTKYKSWRKLCQQNHAQSLQEAIITFFFSVLTLCCIIPHESSCQGDANFQWLWSLLTDGNLPLHTYQSLSGCSSCAQFTEICHTLLSAKQHTPSARETFWPGSQIFQKKPGFLAICSCYPIELKRPMLYHALHPSSCFPKYRHSPHSHIRNSYSSPSICVLYLVLPVPTSKTQKTAKLSLSQITSWQYWVPPFPQTPRVCTTQKAQILHVHAHIHTLCMIHLTFTKVSWYQADMQCKVKYFIPSPTHSAEAHCCTARLSFRKLHSNSLLSIHTFPWTVKSISIPLNTWLCTLVLNAAIYQLCFTARDLFAIHLLPENRGFCFPFPRGRPVAANVTALFADSGNA